MDQAENTFQFFVKLNTIVKYTTDSYFQYEKSTLVFWLFLPRQHFDHRKEFADFLSKTMNC